MQSLTEAPLCACGCGKKVKWRKAYNRWNVYLKGHRKSKVNIPEGVAPLCACGCGEKVKWSKLNRCWNKVILYHQTPYAKEQKRKVGLANRGRKFTEEHRKKLSDAHTGVPLSKEHIKNSAKAHRGLKRSKETRKKISEALKGHPLYLKRIKHACSVDGYCGEWLDEEYKKDCRGSSCEVCGISNMLSLKVYGIIVYSHHIDFNKMNCHPSNFKTVCVSCHSKIHREHDKLKEK